MINKDEKENDKRTCRNSLVQQLSELVNQGVQDTLLIHVCTIVLCLDNSVCVLHMRQKDCM